MMDEFGKLVVVYLLKLGGDGVFFVWIFWVYTLG